MKAITKWTHSFPSLRSQSFRTEGRQTVSVTGQYHWAPCPAGEIVSLLHNNCPHPPFYFEITILDVMAQRFTRKVREYLTGSLQRNFDKSYYYYSFVEESISSTAVTFKSGYGYLQLAGVDPSLSGTLQFSFRTYQNLALLMYQDAGANTTNSFQVTLTSGT